MALADWQQTLEDLKQKFERITPTETGWDIPPDVREAIKTAAAINNNRQRAFTFGQLDVDKVIAAAREGLVKWWMPFNGRAYFGDLAAVEKIHAALESDIRADKEKIDLSVTTDWVNNSVVLAEGMPPQPSGAAVLDFLFAHGADPMHDKGGYWNKALRQGSSDVIRSYIAHGAAKENIQPALAELMGNKNYTQAQNIQEALGVHGFYTKIDNDTIMETKYISEITGDSMFKTLFNFRARRVNEIYENGAKSVMTSSDFSSYDANALREAQEALEKLGGRPPDTLDKPRAKLGVHA